MSCFLIFNTSFADTVSFYIKTANMELIDLTQAKCSDSVAIVHMK